MGGHEFESFKERRNDLAAKSDGRTFYVDARIVGWILDKSLETWCKSAIDGGEK